MCKNHHYFWTFSSPQRNSVPYLPIPSSTHLLAIFILLSVLMSLPCLGTSCKQNHINIFVLCVLSCSVMSNSAAAATKSLQSCPTLCDPIDSSPPGSSISGILQARTLEWVSISFSHACMHAKLLQSCLTLCDPMDSKPPGSSVHGTLQARILGWVAISFSSPVLQAHEL